MLRYRVEDMTCGHCVQTITQALTAFDPAVRVAFDLSSKSVDVTTEAAPGDVAGAIAEAGYTPVRADRNAAPPTKAGCCGHC